MAEKNDQHGQILVVEQLHYTPRESEDSGQLLIGSFSSTRRGGLRQHGAFRFVVSLIWSLDGFRSPGVDTVAVLVILAPAGPSTCTSIPIVGKLSDGASGPW